MILLELQQLLLLQRYLRRQRLLQGRHGSDVSNDGGGSSEGLRDSVEVAFPDAGHEEDREISGEKYARS